jgi:hypothetical protein
VGGGQNTKTFFKIRCKAAGDYTSPPGTCLEPGATVSGEVTDAQRGSIKVSGATVTFKKGGTVVKTATTDVSGRYTVKAPFGQVTVTVTAGGRITKSKSINIAGRINRGQGADLAMSKVLPPGGWRATVSWNAEPRDVDTHVFFGQNAGQQVYYGRLSITAPGTGGVKVDLDRDDTNGYGPETVTFNKIGSCTGTGRCLVKYKIKKYSGSGSLLNGKPIVTVYRGNQVQATYNVNPPANLGRSLYTVFTIDARGQSSIYAGDKNDGPYIQYHRHRQNWWGSFDYQRWSLVPHGAVITGFFRNHAWWHWGIYALEEAGYSWVQNRGHWTCYHANWWGSFDRAGWSTCGGGYFMTGLYRTSGHRAHNIESGHCCKSTYTPNQHVGCSDHQMFGRMGWSECPRGKAMVGMWRSWDNSLNGMDWMRCCEMKQVMIGR